MFGLSKEAYDAFKAVNDKATGDPDDSMICWCKDELIRLAERYDEGYYQVLSCKQVGVAPWNRDGEGLVLSRAISRGKKIKAVGFSFSVMQADALAFEDDPRSLHIAEATVKFTSMDPNCAQYKVHEVKVGPCGATHANHFLAMVHDEVPCTEPLISENGRVSQEKCFRDPNIKKAVQGGVKWFIFRARLALAFPALPKIIQQALNCVSQIAEGHA